MQQVTASASAAVSSREKAFEEQQRLLNRRPEASSPRHRPQPSRKVATASAAAAAAAQPQQIQESQQQPQHYTGPERFAPLVGSLSAPATRRPPKSNLELISESQGSFEARSEAFINRPLIHPIPSIRTIEASPPPPPPADRNEMAAAVSISCSNSDCHKAERERSTRHPNLCNHSNNAHSGDPPLDDVNGDDAVSDEEDEELCWPRPSELIELQRNIRRHRMSRAYADRPPPSEEAIAESRAPNRRVVLNVGGVRHECLWHTLERLPRTRLGRLRRARTHQEVIALCDDYALANNEYFFDRQPVAFAAVLDLYRTGRLHLSEELCVLSFADELRYWQVDELCLEPCCMHRFTQKKEGVLEEIRKETELMRTKPQADHFGRGRVASLRRRLWHLFEDPSSSFLARVSHSLQM